MSGDCCWRPAGGLDRLRAGDILAVRVKNLKWFMVRWFPCRKENVPILTGFHPLFVKGNFDLLSFSFQGWHLVSPEVSVLSPPFIPCLGTETIWHLTLLDLMCFFQEKFQESLKKLRQEQQEAEKLTAVIREKRTSWKVRDSSEGVLEQKSSQGVGAEDKGDPVLSVSQFG